MKFSPFFGTAKIRLLCRICKFFAILFAPGLKSAFFCPVPGKSPYFWNSKKQPERAPRGSKTKKQTCVERKEIPHPIFHRVVPDVFRLDLPRGTTRGPLGGTHGFGAGVCVRRPSCWGGACRRGVAHALGLSGEKSGGSLAACGGVSGLGRAASGQCLCPGNFSRPAGDRLRSPLGRQLHLVRMYTSEPMANISHPASMLMFFWERAGNFIGVCGEVCRCVCLVCFSSAKIGKILRFVV